jgi:hypothetical protein
MRRYDRDPASYGNSRNYFRILALVTILQQECGVRYNPAKIPVDVPLDSADSFIHGVILGDGGTCASLPVVYAAVGRRLGYPIRLVSAKGKDINHMFARWDEPKERFNIEATNQGLSVFDDDYYRRWPYVLNPEHEALGQFLRSKSPRQELAAFLKGRAHRWFDHDQYRFGCEAFAWVSALCPEDQFASNTLKIKLNEWMDRQDGRKPPGFPPLQVRAKERLFPDSLPLNLEQSLCGCWAVQCLLDDPGPEQRYWEPMRRGEFLQRYPSHALATFEDGNCYVDLTVQDSPCATSVVDVTF